MGGSSQTGDESYSRVETKANENFYNFQKKLKTNLFQILNSKYITGESSPEKKIVKMHKKAVQYSHQYGDERFIQEYKKISDIYTQALEIMINKENKVNNAQEQHSIVTEKAHQEYETTVQSAKQTRDEKLHTAKAVLKDSTDNAVNNYIIELGKIQDSNKKYFQDIQLRKSFFSHIGSKITRTSEKNEQTGEIEKEKSSEKKLGEIKTENLEKKLQEPAGIQKSQKSEENPSETP